MPAHVYGPVPSRRLGRSLGVDLVPVKTCDLNCIYCQLGTAPQTTLQRRKYAPLDEVVRGVQQALQDGPRPDYVTLAGSGEPTLHRHFGTVAQRIREVTDIPLALVTNGTLFDRPEVRAECAPLHLVLPSLDAGDEVTFRRVNRPHPGLTLPGLVGGLAALREEFAGQMWLEVFIVEGVNSDDRQIGLIREHVDRIAPHRVQINTAVRPPAEQNVGVPPADRLEEIRRMLGPTAEIIASPHRTDDSPRAAARRDQILQMLQRRPCTAEDIAGGLGVHLHETLKLLRELLAEGRVQRRQRLYETYYEAA